MYLHRLVPWGGRVPQLILLLDVQLGGLEGEPWGRGSERRAGVGVGVTESVQVWWGEVWPGSLQ